MNQYRRDDMLSEKCASLSINYSNISTNTQKIPNAIFALKSALIGSDIIYWLMSRDHSCKQQFELTR